MANKSFGKTLLRLSSMLIAVIMLVTTMFTGIASAEQAEDFGTGNTIKITNYAWVQCGQNVVLEAGKTYLYSYYYSGPNSVGGVMYYGDGTGATAIEPIHMAYDQDYRKITYKFVAPETATPAGEEGKVKIYLGFQIPSADSYIIYYPCVYAADDATKTNLFYDYLITGKYSLTAAEGGTSNWYKPYNDAVIGYRASRPNLSSEGGLDIFKKTDAERHVLKLEAGVSGMPYFGQRISLEPGKTYIYSNCYLPGTEPYLQVCYPDATALSSQVIYDNDWWRQGLKFTVPADAPVEEDGKALIFIGFRGHNSSTPLYYYDFKLYDVELPEFNLLKDNVLEGGDFEVKADTWKTPGGSYVNSNYSEVTLESVGGIDTFKKTDADRNVIKLAVDSKASLGFFGQKIALEGGKTYVFSNYYTGTENAHVIRKDDGSYTNVTPDITNIDNDCYKITSVFTVPSDMISDENGNKPLWIGMQCGNYGRGTETYYYDLKLYEINNPEVNLLEDADLADGGTDFNSIWKKPSSALEAGYFSKTNLEAVGGMDIFKKTDAERHVLKLTPETSGQPYFGQRVSLTPGKTYVYSNYYLSGIPANQQVCFPDLTQIDTEIISDNTYSKQGVKFTVPADASVDENGKVLIFVGFRGNYSSDPIYYYDLRLYEVNNPELNLLNDAALLGADFEVKADTWKTPGNNYVNPNGVVNYSEVTLESIGGISAFLPYEVKCDLTLDEIVDIRDLVRMKKFGVGSIDALPDGTGNLNCDTVIGGADDLILLRKEILK